MKRLKSKSLVILIITAIIILLQASVVNAETRNNDPMLKGIKINGIDIDPPFEMFTTEYVVTVGDDVEQAEIEGIPDDENATVEVVGDKNLKEGRNEFEIKVTAENGVNKQSYFVYITKGDTSKSNANLKNLKVGNYELAPTFDKNTINYAFEYPQSLESVEIEAVPESENAKVEIIGNENLTDVSQNIEVRVTAEDGQTVKTYYLIAKKADMEVEDPQGSEPENVIENTTESLKEENTDSNTLIYVIATIVVIIVIIILSKFIMERRKKGDGK